MCGGGRRGGQGSQKAVSLWPAAVTTHWLLPRLCPELEASRAEMTFLGTLGLIPPGLVARRKAVPRAVSLATLVALEPEARDLKVGKGPRPPSPPQLQLQSAPWAVGATLVSLSQAPW